MDIRTETFQAYKGDFPVPENEALPEKGWGLGEHGYSERFFEGVSEYFSHKRENDPDNHAAHFAYLEALEKARRWVGLFNFGSKEHPFIGEIKVEYKAPALKGRSFIFPGLFKFWVKQRIKVTVAALIKNPEYSAEHHTTHDSMQTYLPKGPAPFYDLNLPNPDVESIGNVPFSIYHIFSGLMNSGKESFELVNNLTKKLKRYNAWDGTLNAILNLNCACEEFEFFTFHPSHVGVRLTIPFIYDMREEKHFHAVPDLQGSSM